MITLHSSLIDTYDPDLAVVVTKDYMGESDYRQTKIVYTPAWMV